MIDTTETPEVRETKQDAEQRGTADAAALRKEAAKYRTRAKEAEAERDKLVERVTAMQRSEVERLASTAAADFQPLADGSDVWRSDVELDALLAEDGAVNPDAVRERVAELAESRPHYLARPKTADGDADQRKGAAPKTDAAPSFGEALKGA